MKKFLFFTSILLMGIAIIYFYLSSSPKIVQTIIVVRHAQAYKNLAKIPTNIEKDSLTDFGKKQAASLGKMLKNRKIDLWISSTKTRAIQTRDIALSHNLHSSKKETVTEFLSMQKGGKGWDWRVKNWKEGKDPRPEHGESLEDATTRSLKKIKEYSSVKTIIIFSHADICATLIGHTVKTPITQRYKNHEISLSSYAEIGVLENGDWILK